MRGWQVYLVMTPLPVIFVALSMALVEVMVTVSLRFAVLLMIFWLPHILPSENNSGLKPKSI